MTPLEIQIDNQRTRQALQKWAKLDQAKALPLRSKDWKLGSDGFRRNPLSDEACCYKCLVKMRPDQSHGWNCDKT